ncbi:MAG: EAL domain-containing protein [Desulfobacterales bacterium]|nr:EAL domain-containing protein [Desulfobacterales bacterium]
MSSLSIRTKFMAAFLVIGLVPIICVAVFSVMASRNILTSQILNQLENYRDIKSAQVDTYIRDRFRDLDMVAAVVGRTEIARLTSSHAPCAPLPSQPPLRFLCEFVTAYGYDGLYLMDASGQMLYALSVAGPRARVETNASGLGRMHRRVMDEGQPVFEDFSLERGRIAAYLGCPFTDAGGRDCVMALELPAHGINQLLNDQERFKRTMDLYMVGPDGSLRTDSFLEPVSHSVAASLGASEGGIIRTRPVAQALGGETGTMVAEDYRGVSVLSAYGPVTVMGENWGMLAEVDLSEALAPLDWIYPLVAGVGLALAGGLFWFSSLFVRRVFQPVGQLRRASEQVTQGDFDIQLPTEDRGEFGLLGRAFNAMVDAIREKAASLEEKVDALERAQGDIRAGRERFQSLVETSSDWVWEMGPDFTYTYVGAKVEDILGYEPNELLGKSLFDLVPAGKGSAWKAGHRELMYQGYNRVEVQLTHRNGEVKILESSGISLVDSQGRCVGFRGMDRDVSQQKQIEAQLLLSQRIFDNTVEGIAVTDLKGQIRRVNPAFCEITGYSRADALGMNIRMLRSQRHDPEFYLAMDSQVASEGYWCGEIWNRRMDGSAFPEWLSISLVPDPGGQPSSRVYIFHDISEKKLKEEQVKFLSFHDPLTRLPNRKLFYDRAQVALMTAKRKKRRVGFLFMDMDNFMEINDTFGHPFGDAFLCAVKDRIGGICRKSDTFARYGGDEFVIVLNDIVDSHAVEAFARRVITLFKTPVMVEETEVFTSVSIGISIYPDDGVELVTLEKNADMALGEAKRDGKRKYCLFQQTLGDRLIRKTQLENELRRSITDFVSFSLHYQPKVDVLENRITGVEALLRWEYDGNLVSPGEFIPIAEENNSILPLGEWVMQRAMLEIKQLHDMGYGDISLAINLSSKQFKDARLFEKIKSLLALTGFDKSRLCFEITESIPMADVEGGIRIMEEFKRMGIQLSLDDFGTGYSSLGYLNKFPIQELKIDRSFIKDLPLKADDSAISRATLKMAHSLDLQVVAEGVENLEQLNFLKENGCRYIQGYLFYKPMPLSELKSVMAENEIPRPELEGAEAV